MAMATSSPSSRRMPLVSGYIRLMDAVSRASAYVAAVMFVAGVLAICHMVFVRYALGMSTAGRPNSPSSRSPAPC